MDNTILVAVISVSGSILAAAASYFFTKRQQLEAEWRASKFNHYRDLLSAISDLAIDNKSADAHQRFALAFNTIALVASQPVVQALLEYHDGIKASNPDRSIVHDRLLTNVVLAIRADLGMKPKDNPATFNYHLVGAPPKSGTT